MITQSHPSAEVQRQERQQSRMWLFALLTVAGLGAAVAIDAGAVALSQYPTTHPDCATAHQAAAVLKPGCDCDYRCEQGGNCRHRR